MTNLAAASSSRLTNAFTRATHRILIPLLAIAGAIFLSGLLQSAPAVAQTVDPCAATGMELLNTDKWGYESGETVHFTGTGYAPNCTYTITVIEPTNMRVTTDPVTTDTGGNVAYDYPIVNGVKEVYWARIVGQDGNDLAGVMFSDANACDATVPVTLPAPVTIQQGISALPNINLAGTPCVLTVLPGNYTTNLIVGTSASGKNIGGTDTNRYIIKAQAPGTVTLNWANSPNSGITSVFQLRKSSFITIQDFIITGAPASGGRAIELLGGSDANHGITIDGNIISGTTLAPQFGILISGNGSPQNDNTWIVNNLIRNIAGNPGTAVSISGSSAGPVYLVNNTIYSNSGDGLSPSNTSTVRAVNNLFVSNSGFGARCVSCTSANAGNRTLQNNLFYKNTSGDLNSVTDWIEASGPDSGNYTPFPSWSTNGTSGNSGIDTGRAAAGTAGCVFPSLCASTLTAQSTAVTAIFNTTDFKLTTPTSPALDKGVNSYAAGSFNWVPSNDFEDESRWQNAAVDIGYDESVFQYVLTYSAGAGGTITGTTPQSVAYQGSGTAVTAAPNSGYHFVQWSDGSTANPRTDTNVTANITVTATFSNTYTLTYAAGANGTINGVSPQTVTQGGNGTAVTAAPNLGYHFVQWSDGSTANPRTDTNVTANISVTATFSNTYTLTYTTDGNGTIAPAAAATQTVNSGTNGAAVTASPSAGYAFVKWSDNSTANPRTDLNVTADISVQAQFVKTYTLTYTTDGNGTITPAAAATQTVNSGTNGAAVTASPSAGYAFVKWSDNSTANPRTDLNVTADISVQAQFVKTYTLTYTTDGNGTITPAAAATQTVNSGTNGAAVTASPSAGYAFVKWSDNSTANPRTDLNVTADISVQAQFVKTYTLTYTTDGNGTITPAAAATQTVNSGTNGAAVTASPSAGYAFVKWSDNSTANPRTDLNVTADISVQAQFVKTYTLTYTTDGNGTITPAAAATQTVNSGTNGAAVTASPSAGYAFVKWSDNSTANPRTDLNVTADISVQAQFVKTYTLTYTTDGNGTITPAAAATQTVNSGTNGAAVTASPSAGYAFVKWSDNSTTNPRTDMNVTANVNVQAQFAQTFTLTYTTDGNGTITPAAAATQTVNSGTNGAAVTASPSAGYAFVKWSDNSTTNPRTDMNVTANVNVQAQFAQTFTLTYTTDGSGTITPAAAATQTGVVSGTNGASVTAAANPGFVFVKWSDNSTANPRTDMNVTANVSVQAMFAQTFTLTYTTDGSGTITPAAAATQTGVVSGTNGASVTAAANPGFVFVKWSDNSTANPRTDMNVTANVSVQAMFAQTFTLTYTTDGNGTISPAAAATQTGVVSGTNGASVTAAANPGFVFVKWSDNSTTNPRTDMNVTANVNVQAQFAQTFTLTYTTDGNGAISPAAAATQTGVVSGTNGASVTAAANPGFVFVKWSDNSTANPRTDMNVTANVNVQAQFASQGPNAPPVTTNTLANPNPAPVGTNVVLTATLTDALDDVVSAEYSIEGVWHSFPAFAQAPIVTVSKTLTGLATGVYDVCVRGTDSANPANTAGPNTGMECIYVAVYNPNAGFVTGGGWIMSPPEALKGAGNEGVTGKANFGFVAKIEKGNNPTPTGETEFNFKAGNLNFHSTSYEWLVVSGSKAQFKGCGTINGAGNCANSSGPDQGYEFSLTAVDGAIAGNGKPDKFRMRIWDRSQSADGNSGLIYDNQVQSPSCLDTTGNAEPCTTIAGGSIVIHK